MKILPLALAVLAGAASPVHADQIQGTPEFQKSVARFYDIVGDALFDCYGSSKDVPAVNPFRESKWTDQHLKLVMNSESDYEITGDLMNEGSGVLFGMSFDGDRISLDVSEPDPDEGEFRLILSQSALKSHGASDAVLLYATDNAGTADWLEGATRYRYRCELE